MLVLLILSVIAGVVVSGITGVSFLGWATGSVFFVLGLPGALIGSFIHEEVSYAQDCADYRETMAEIAAADLADEHEYAEDERIDRLVGAVRGKRGGDVYNDNRQVHIHGGRV